MSQDQTWLGARPEFGLLIDRMAKLLAAFTDFVVLIKDSVHGADRAKIDGLHRAGWHRPRRGAWSDEPRFAQQIEDRLALAGRPAPARVWAADEAKPARR